MKKAIIAVFSISLTAGVCYLTYSQLKDFFINKLLAALIVQGKKKNIPFDEKQIRIEFDKLFIWQVKLLLAYYTKAISGGTEKEISPLIEKIKKQKIRERINLTSIDALMFGT